MNAPEVLETGLVTEVRGRKTQLDAGGTLESSLLLAFRVLTDFVAYSRG